MQADKKKKEYKTSFRSVIHATDSTRIGCIPKSNAPIKAAVLLKPNFIKRRYTKNVQSRCKHKLSK